MTLDELSNADSFVESAVVWIARALINVTCSDNISSRDRTITPWFLTSCRFGSKATHQSVNINRTNKIAENWILQLVSHTIIVHTPCNFVLPNLVTRALPRTLNGTKRWIIYLKSMSFWGVNIDVECWNSRIFARWNIAPVIWTRLCCHQVHLNRCH